MGLLIVKSAVGNAKASEEYKPLPWVATIIMRSDALILIISQRTFDNPVLDGCQSVDAPLIKLVLHTPNSVATKACVVSPGLNTIHLIGISGKLPSMVCQFTPKLLVSNKLTTP